MPENEVKKRTRRTAEERAAVVDDKIKKVKETIAQVERTKADADKMYADKISSLNEQVKKLEEKKAQILAPKPHRKTKKQKIAEMVKMAEKSGMKLDEIASRLDVQVPN